MTAPVDLPVYGKVNIGKTTKENLLGFWMKVAKQTKLKINYNERMESVQPTHQGFVVTTNKASYITNNILLAIGRRGTPNKLGVPGEQLSKVVYGLIDSEQYRNQNVLVVGGGNSALEAAIAVAKESGTVVTLSYRGSAFTRAQEKLRTRVEQIQSKGLLKVIFNSEINTITPESVVIKKNNKLVEIPNDAVIISAGGLLPTAFLKKMGIIIETKHGTA